MQIKSHTITITEDEKDTLGIALELYLEREMKTVKNFELFKDIEEDTIEMLQEFIRCGYSPVISNKKFEFKHYTDAWQWLEDKHKEVV